jgi:hypothetical protein
MAFPSNFVGAALIEPKITTLNRRGIRVERDALLRQPLASSISMTFDVYGHLTCDIIRRISRHGPRISMSCSQNPRTENPCVGGSIPPLGTTTNQGGPPVRLRRRRACRPFPPPLQRRLTTHPLSIAANSLGSRQRRPGLASASQRVGSPFPRRAKAGTTLGKSAACRRRQTKVHRQITPASAIGERIRKFPLPLTENLH